MTHFVWLNLIFFIIPMSGACAFAYFVFRMLRGGDPPPPPEPPPGGTKVPSPRAGPDDLARSA